MPDYDSSEAPYGDEKPASTGGLPHSREAEEAVIGAVLINPEVYYDLAQFLQPDDFYIHRLRFIWEAYVRLQERRVPIDSLTVSEELEDMSRLEEIGGPAYLAALLNQVPTTLHAEAYGKIVEATSVRRKLLTAANAIATLAYDETEAIDTVMGEAEKAIFNVGERQMRHDVRPIREVLSEYYDHVDELARRGDEIVGVPTGFTDLDKMLGGLQPSDLLITAGRPGMGKTALMLTIVHNAALIHKKRVAVFSLEMSNEQLVQRLIAQQTGIDSQRLRSGKLTDEDWPIFNHAIEVLGDTRIYLDDTPALTPLQLRTKCRRLHMEYGIDLIILDYLQLMSSETRNDNRVQEVSYISRSLKQLAREINVPLMAAAQLSRAVEQRADKEPQLSDLRESGCLTGDTLVTLVENGQNVPIRDLEGRENFQVWALNPETLKLEAASVSRAFTTGVKPVHKLVTRLGRTIRATANHRFLTVRGWKRLDELMADDYIALPSEMQKLADSQIYWDSLEAILPDGEELVFDLTVPGLQNFVANNLIVHNSLEQDADIVMFIHRDEKDPTMANVTHLKIAKHRNGPVGQIDLIFRSNLTKFENAATRNVDLNA
jgi:replicative DNA helicase